MKNIRNFFTIATLILLPTLVKAQSLENARNQLQGMDYTVGHSATGQDGLIELAQSLLDRLPYFLSILAFAALLYSGGMYVFALGDAQKQETAKKNLTWTIYGMLAMSLVLVGIRIVASFASATTRFQDIPNFL